MIPRADIFAVSSQDSFDDIINQMSAANHSRVPVYRDTLDDVVGIIHIKDLFAHLRAGDTPSVDKLLRPALFISPAIRLLDLLHEMRLRRRHLALVVDEFGGVDGLITIEDLVEQIVGEIEDEHDKTTTPRFEVKDDGTAIADARLEVEDLESVAGKLLDDDERDEVDTVGGRVFALAGRVPGRGEVVRHRAGIASLALPPLFILPALFLLGMPVWKAIHAPSRLAAARIFGAAGLGWFLASTFWVSHALIVEASSLWVLTPFVALALAFILALFWAVAAALSWTHNGSAVVRLLCLIAVFGVTEWSRSFVATGFPWSLMGGLFAVHLGSLQMASLMGVYGLTLLAFGAAMAPLFWILSARGLALLLVMIPLLGTGWGVLRLDSQLAASSITAPSANGPSTNAPKARLVQPVVPQNDKWNRQKRPAHLASLIALSQTGTSSPDLAAIS